MRPPLYTLAQSVVLRQVLRQRFLSILNGLTTFMRPRLYTLAAIDNKVIGSANM